jgi:putative phosphoesterase
MRIAALYDIHGNLPALDAVLAEVAREGVDLVVVGGDVVPGPMPGECLDRLLALELPVRFIRGNGERAVMDEAQGRDSGVPAPFREGVRWNAGQLTADHLAEIERWPETLRMEVPGIGDVLFCHATPRNDSEIFTRITPEERLVPVFADADAALVVCGHTHMQFDRTVGRTRVVNAGSVGMPFGAPGAYWILLGSGVELRHTHYDLEGAAAAVRATAYPGAEALAAGNIVEPPSEAAMLEAFAKAEVG